MFGKREDAFYIDDYARLHLHRGQPQVQDHQLVEESETEESFPAPGAPRHADGLHCGGRTGRVRKEKNLKQFLEITITRKFLKKQ